MRNIFRGYYSPTSEEFTFIWENCIFVFDTNVLLNLYRYSPETSKILIELLFSLKERIWLPYQFAFEYHNHYLDQLIVPQEYNNTKKALADFNNKLANELNHLKNRTGLKVDELLKQFRKSITQIEKKIDAEKAKHQLYLDTENIADRIASLFENKIGVRYNSDKLQEVYREGKKRYENLEPPGFGDKSKPEPQRYGDLVGWFQIIEQASQSKKPIILVTEDSKKDDWYWLKEGKTLGPHPALVQEMYEKANVAFYIYSIDQFLAKSKEYIQTSVTEDAIQEVKVVQEYDEKQIEIIEHAVNTYLKKNVEQYRNLARSLGETEYSKLLNSTSNIDIGRQISDFVKNNPSILTHLNTDFHSLFPYQSNFNDVFKSISVLTQPNFRDLLFSLNNLDANLIQRLSSNDFLFDNNTIQAIRKLSSERNLQNNLTESNSDNDDSDDNDTPLPSELILK